SMIARRRSCSSEPAALPAFSGAAAEDGGLPCELFDLGIIFRRLLPRRGHPRAAHASNICKREIIRSLLRVDTAGWAENQIGQRPCNGSEISSPPDRLGGEEFERCKPAFFKGQHLG